MVLGLLGKDKLTKTLNDWSELIWEGTLEMVKDDDDEVEDGEGKGVEVGDGVGVGVEVTRLKDQVLLHSLQVPFASFALTLQYQVPFDNWGV